MEDLIRVRGLGTGNVVGHYDLARCNDIAEWGVKLWIAMGIDGLCWIVELMWINSGDRMRG